MGYAAWRPEVKGNDHIVEVDGGGFWSSTFEAKLDGQTVGRRSYLASLPPWNWGGTKVEFDLKGERASLVGTRFFGWTWELYVGGKKIT